MTRRRPIRRTDVFRDHRVHVQAAMCATCIFRKDIESFLAPGTAAQMLTEATEIDGVIPCHETTGRRGQLVCAGFYARRFSHPHRLLQIAERLRLVEFVRPVEQHGAAD